MDYCRCLPTARPAKGIVGNALGYDLIYAHIGNVIQKWMAFSLSPKGGDVPRSASTNQHAQTSLATGLVY